jgi:hypothetical protein
MDWKEKARKKHNEEKAKAKQRLKERIIEHLQRDRTDMSGWGVGQLGISALECEVILDLYEKEKL